MFKSIKRKYIQLIAIVMISGAIFASMYQFNHTIEALFEEQITNLIIESTETQKLVFRTKLAGEIETLNVLSTQLATQFTTYEQSASELRKLVETSGFEALGIVDKTGNVYFDKMTNFNISDRPYFKAVMAGESLVTQPLTLDEAGNQGIVRAVPLIIDGETNGIVFGITSLQALAFELTTPSFSGQNYAYILDKEGNIIASINTDTVPNQTNLFTLISENNIEVSGSNLDYEAYKELLRKGSGILKYEANGQQLAYYQEMGFNDWIILGIVPTAAFEVSSDFITTQMIGIVLSIIVVVTLFSIYIIYQNYINKREIENQLDIARMSEAKYRIALEQSDNMIFEYLVSKNELLFSNQTIHILGLKQEVKYTPELLVEQNFFVQGAELEWLQLFTQVKQGQSQIGLTVLFQLDGLSLQAYDIYLTTIFNSDGQPMRAIGKLVNVHAQREYTAKLHEYAQRDSLTQLYNKLATEQKIQQILKQSNDKYHALFIIDIDNFKKINDQFGHFVGDKVIQEVAKNLQGICRDTDIAGRIGGDEFLIFLKDINNTEIVERKAQKICEMFRAYYLSQTDHKISGSVGIVVIKPNQESNFQELYEAADAVMYQAKKNGKDQYKILF
ncbi:MAG: sensor domain-containing diguanylate cyclase [Culicoidibacterales bacterium]